MNRSELENHILQTYGVKAEYPWAKFPNYAVFRHEHNRKWFAVIMDLPKEKLGIEEEGIIDAVNLKCDPDMIGSLRMESGFYPAYHMDKSNWISVVLNDGIDSEKLEWLIEMSFDLTGKRKK